MIILVHSIIVGITIITSINDNRYHHKQLKSVVGSAERKGISGGQRRRVSVAVEMMKESDLFLLDGE